MIDISNEHLIAVRDVPGRLPPRPTGRRIHISAVYRWIQRGIRGVRLEVTRVGGTAYTSEEALQRFADRSQELRGHDPVGEIRHGRARQRQVEEATKAVDAILGGKKT
jgi:hypothetical protein